jgi:hypothetical protein
VSRGTPLFDFVVLAGFFADVLDLEPVLVAPASAVDEFFALSTGSVKMPKVNKKRMASIVSLSSMKIVNRSMMTNEDQ